MHFLFCFNSLFYFIVTFSWLFLIRHIRLGLFVEPAALFFIRLFHLSFFFCRISERHKFFKCLISDDNNRLKRFVWLHSPHHHDRRFARIRSNLVEMLTIALLIAKTNLLRSHWSKKWNSTVNTLIGCFWLVVFFFCFLIGGFFVRDIFSTCYVCVCVCVCSILLCSYNICCYSVFIYAINKRAVVCFCCLFYLLL